MQCSAVQHVPVQCSVYSSNYQQWMQGSSSFPAHHLPCKRTALNCTQQIFTALKDDLGTPELGTLELGTLELGTLELGTLELETLELETLELGTLELETPELEILELNTLDTRTRDTRTKDKRSRGITFPGSGLVHPFFFVCEKW